MRQIPLPDKVYEWGPLKTSGACGAGVDRDRATQAFYEALRATPGDEGEINESVLTGTGEYHRWRVLGHAFYDASSGAVIWSE